MPPNCGVRVAPSLVHGLGLFTTRRILAGTAFALFGGSLRVMSASECEANPNALSMLQLDDLDAYVDPTALYKLPCVALISAEMSLAHYGAYANSCVVTIGGVRVPAPNAVFVSVKAVDEEIECLELVATRTIGRGEEVIVDYHWTFQTDCHCNGDDCKRLRRKLKFTK